MDGRWLGGGAHAALTDEARWGPGTSALCRVCENMENTLSCRVAHQLSLCNAIVVFAARGTFRCPVPRSITRGSMEPCLV